MNIIRGKDIPFVAASHEDPVNPNNVKKVLLRAGDLIDGYIQMVNWAKLPVGKSFSAHYHQDMQEIFIIVKGQGEMTVGKEKEALGEGDCVVVPIKEVHILKNSGKEGLEYIVFGIATGKGGKTIVI